MINNLLNLKGFLNSPAGIAVFCVAAAALLILILDLNYRLFAKRLLDFIASLITVCVISPLLIVCAVISKVRSENGSVLDYADYIGLNGKVISVSGFAGISGPLKNLSCILDVLCGKLSMVGPKLVESGDAALIEDGAMERFSVRPGLVSPLAVSGGEQLTYEEMFAADVRYIKRREMFMDFGILICAAVKGIRGDGKKYLGEAAEKSYAQTLLQRGAITEEDVITARNYAAEASKKN
mgnify:FL=1